MSEPPTGTLTHLFTDLEGSTALWQAHPEAMNAAVARHDALLRAAIEANGGHLVKATGDGFYAVFRLAPDALRAALQAQRDLASESWGPMPPLRVRMGLHTDVAELREGDYFGTAVNRTARLMSAGHGGQVLLSAATQDLVRDELPLEVRLQDLGEHRLKDLERAEHIYQASAFDLFTDFPPLRSLDQFPHNLPHPVTSFIGREKEIGEAKRLLTAARLLTLTGSGGCGKSRLALQVAADRLEDFPDGAWLVELAALSDPGLVPQAVASVLKVREEPDRSLSSTLAERLKSRTLLLLLDNCEHLLAATAELAEGLLHACPNLRILTSSREGLGIAGEVTYRIPSLSLPDPNHLPPPDSLDQYEAVRLFIDRAVSVQPAFSVTRENAPALAQVCHRLDGIPLALELAAARVRVLSVEQILERLKDRFRLLTGGSRTALPRQQTLRAMIDWSYDLLSEPERILLRRLSVFAGGWTLEAAEAVCSFGGIEAWEVLDLLSSLVEKSLAIYAEPKGGGRYHLLETVRQYARDRLMESDGGAETQHRHRDYFGSLAGMYRPTLSGAEEREWFDRLEGDHDNLRTAMEARLSEPGWEEEGLALVAAMRRFWEVRCHWKEGRQWLERALARDSAPERTGAYAAALTAVGSLATLQGDFLSAQDYLLRSQEMAHELGDPTLETSALRRLGLAAWHQGDSPAAYRWYERAWRLNCEVGNRAGESACLRDMGYVSIMESDELSAGVHLTRALDLAREVRDQKGEAASLILMSRLASMRGEYPEAQSYLKRGEAIARALGDLDELNAILRCLGQVAMWQGDYSSAETYLQHSLDLCRTLGIRDDEAWTLRELGRVAMGKGNYESARSSMDQALEIVRLIGDRWQEVILGEIAGEVARHLRDLPSSRTYYEQALQAACAIGNQAREAWILRALAGIDMEEHAHVSAQRHLEQALEAIRATGDRQHEAWCLCDLGYAFYWRGDYPGARPCFEAALEINRTLDNPLGEVGNLLGLGRAAKKMGEMEGVYFFHKQALMAHGRYAEDRETVECLHELAYCLSWKGRAEHAARLLGTAEALRETLNIPMDGNERAEFEAETARLKADLGEAPSEKAGLEGRAMTLEQTVASLEEKPL